MLEPFCAFLEASTTADVLRGSLWVYPAINTGHIIGIALLFGGILPIDLRLLGMWPQIPLLPLLQVLMKTAAWGVFLALVCGSLLFITRACSYLGSDIFMVKMIIVAAGLLNGLILRIVLSPSMPPQWVTTLKVPPAVRLAAGFSLGAWITALVLGRLIGYVH